MNCKEVQLTPKDQVGLPIVTSYYYHHLEDELAYHHCITSNVLTDAEFDTLCLQNPKVKALVKACEAWITVCEILHSSMGSSDDISVAIDEAEDKTNDALAPFKEVVPRGTEGN